MNETEGKEVYEVKEIKELGTPAASNIGTARLPFLYLLYFL
jgi:hypothetical protein